MSRTNWNQLREERRAKMSPEKRAYSDGYSDGFADAYSAWEVEISETSLRGILRLRRDIKKLMEERRVNNGK